MKSKLFEPRRLRDSTESSRSVEGRLALQLRILADYAPLPQLRRTSSIPRRQRSLIVAFRMAMIVLLLALVSGAGAAATYVVRRVWPKPAASGRGNSHALSEFHRSLPVVRPVAVPGPQPEQPVAAPALVPAAPGPANLLPARRTRPASADQSKVPHPSGQPPVPLTPASALEPPALPAGTSSPSAVGSQGASQVRADGVSQEAAILRQALSALRRERNPRRALALLDDYDGRFAGGALAWEATSARAQALLALGDRGRALTLLDRLPLRQDGQTGDLWVTRGELRSLAGRCAEALRDFDAILSANRDRSQMARALFGRASCRVRLGDLAGAEQDRQRYLREFPQGPAAKQLMTSP